jgi:hypothetical protein
VDANLSKTRNLYEAWRRPLSPRGSGATLATLGIGLLSLVAVFVTTDSTLQPRVALSGIGLVVLMIGVARPRFAWKFDLGWRWFLGDRGFAALHIVLGVSALVAAWVAPL